MDGKVLVEDERGQLSDFTTITWQAAGCVFFLVLRGVNFDVRRLLTFVYPLFRDMQYCV